MKFAEYKNLDLSKTNKEILDKWHVNHVFEKSIEQREGSPSFIFYEGPPSANGIPGIHHVMARSIKDIFCRYKTMKGFRVHRKAGTTGRLLREPVLPWAAAHLSQDSITGTKDYIP